MAAPDPLTAAGPEETLSGRFVAGSLVVAVVVALTLCFGLPAWAASVSEQVTPAGAIQSGRASLQPQPGWDLLSAIDPEVDEENVLVKDAVVLQLVTVPSDDGTDPATYLDALLAEFDENFIADYEAVEFLTPTQDRGAAFTATGTSQSGMFAAIVSRDGDQVALIPVVGDPVAVTALMPEIADMITGVRFKRAP